MGDIDRRDVDLVMQALLFISVLGVGAWRAKHRSVA